MNDKGAIDLLRAALAALLKASEYRDPLDRAYEIQLALDALKATAPREESVP